MNRRASCLGNEESFPFAPAGQRHPHISAVVRGADAAERVRADPEWKGSVHGSPEVCGIQLVAFDSRHRAGVSPAGSRTDGRCLHPGFSNRTNRTMTEREQQRSRVALDQPAASVHVEVTCDAKYRHTATLLSPSFVRLSLLKGVGHEAARNTSRISRSWKSS